MGDEYLRSLTGSDVALDFQFLAQLATLNSAFERNPGDATIVHRALGFLEGHRREDLMATWAERAYRINPHHETSIFAAASCYELVGQFDKAIPLWSELASGFRNIDPLGLNLAQALCGNGNLDESFAVCEAALEKLLNGDTIQSRLWDHKTYMLRFLAVRSEIRLRRGNPVGFADHEAMLGFRVPSYVVPDVAYWAGEPLTGKHLLVTPLGGYGDQLLFHAAIPALVKLAGRVSVGVHPDLLDLTRTSLPDCNVFATPMAKTLMESPSPELAAFVAKNKPDIQTNTFAVPNVRYTLRPKDDFAFPPYLKVPAAATAGLIADLKPILERAGTRKLVGIAWDRAQRHHPHIVGGVEACRTARSSYPVEGVTKLVSDPRLTDRYHFVALHETGALRTWPKPMPDNLSTIYIAPGDFNRTAAVIMRCAYVATVDMSVANLSAMLGQKTLLMMAHEGDIRWGYQGKTTPWVRNVETFRQRVPRDWSAVCEDLTVSLAQK